MNAVNPATVLRRRRRRRMLAVLIALALCFSPLVLAAMGVDVPPVAYVLPVGAVLVVSAWLLREGYLDARTRGLSIPRSSLAALKALFVGWWSTGL